MANQVSLDSPAPDFALSDASGVPFRLSELVAQKHVILVFNRGFT